MTHGKAVAGRAVAGRAVAGKAGLLAAAALGIGIGAVAVGDRTEAKPPVPPAAATSHTPTLPRGRTEFGYLKARLPDGLMLSPPPPETGSPAEERDLAAARSAFALRDGPRWQLAIRDADIFSPTSTGAFSCAAGVAIGPRETPRLHQLLQKSLADLADSTSDVKEAFRRPRPFMVNGEPTCTPGSERSLRGNGSYPSGHSAIGYGWGLILAELVPQRSARIVARGRAFGDSRRICNVHWLSDVEEGRIAAAAAVARLHAEPAFRQDMEAARAELAGVTAKPAACDAETAALGG